MIRSLNYIGFDSPNAAAWSTFGPEVLGAQLAVPGADGAVRLRVDDHEARIIIHPGDAERVAYLGWDVGDTAGFDAATGDLESKGFSVTHGDHELAETRRVERIATFVDPFGFRHELASGLLPAGPFVPGRPISGFLTGEGGLGHMVLLVPNLEQADAFYGGVLGFKLSDTVEQGMTLRFYHCNPRHHTVALAEVPGMVGIHHLMLELNSIDDVGSGLDIVNERNIPLAMSLGRHTNDLMTSFYVRTPSGFEIEYGTGGREVDDSTWETDVYDAPSLWGHKPPATGGLMPQILRPFQPAKVSS